MQPKQLTRTGTNLFTPFGSGGSINRLTGNAVSPIDHIEDRLPRDKVEEKKKHKNYYHSNSGNDDKSNAVIYNKQIPTENIQPAVPWHTKQIDSKKIYDRTKSLETIRPQKKLPNNNNNNNDSNFSRSVGFDIVKRSDRPALSSTSESLNPLNQTQT